MKYTIILSQNGVKKRTVIEAETELYARRKLLDKASGKVLIDSCKEVNPFLDSKNILDFFKGYMR